MKYKVGDPVQIKKDLVTGDIHGGMKVNTGMYYLRGETSIVESFNDGEYHLKGLNWTWTEEMLVPYNQEMIFIRKYGKKVIAEYKKGKKTINKAVAECEVVNGFDFHEGARIALDGIINPSKTEINVFDKVRVTNGNHSYGMFGQWFDTFLPLLKDRYRDNLYPMENKTYVVLAKGNHTHFQGVMLYAIMSDSGLLFLIGGKDIEKVYEE